MSSTNDSKLTAAAEPNTPPLTGSTAVQQQSQQDAAAAEMPTSSEKGTSSPTTDEAPARRQGTYVSTNEMIDAMAAEKDPGFWQRVKASFKGQTRKGRIAAQAQALQAERQRQREMDPSPFKYRPIELGELVDPKNVEMLRDMGGIDGLIDHLGTDAQTGLDLKIDDPKAVGEHEAERDIEAAPADKKGANWVKASAEDRKRIYGSNYIPPKKGKSLLLLMWLALQDKILILLCVVAVISLALGLYTDFGAEPEQVPCANPPPGRTTCDAAPVDWVEGVAILIAVAIVDIVGSLNDYQKELQFKKLNAKKEERNVKVIRAGKPSLMSVHEVQVGDVLQLEPGEIIPADGVFLRGHNVKCDESGATGESDMIKKIPYEEALAVHEAGEKHKDCFLISGSRVLEGQGEYVVIAVGPSSFNGKLMLSLQGDAEETPLQVKLNRLAELIAYLGAASGLLLFVVLFIRFLVDLGGRLRTANADQRGADFIQILIISITIVVVSVPEGLPLAVTVALAFATKRMTKENLLVRLLGSCETMANVSVICTDKTGTLTQNDMSVVAGSVGVRLKFAYNSTENTGRQDIKEGDFAVDQADLNSHLSEATKQLLNDAIAVNSSAFEEDPAAKAAEAAAKAAQQVPAIAKRYAFIRKLLPAKKVKAAAEEAKATSGFVGSKTETALLKMAKELHWEDYRSARERNEVVTSFPFSSERKAMGVVVKRREGGYRFFVKGASEVLTRICTRYLDVDEGAAEKGDSAVTIKDLDEAARQNVSDNIVFYANQTLRTIAICYRDLPDAKWPPADAEFDSEGDIKYSSLAKDLTLLAITGIEDPLRPGVRDAVATCRKAGCTTVMVTGDNALTARSIATQCGILTEGGVVMEGPVFRKLNDAEMADVVPKLQVLARSSPEDKKILVERHKKMGDIVAVTGDGTNDGPALKTANVGFSMGIAGTEVAKEASDIVLMDDNFASLVKAIMWGRCVNDAVRKFLQFQLSVNIGAVLITFITAVSNPEEGSSLTAVQLLWLNLIMDTLAALALATDPADPDCLNKPPKRNGGVLITVDMWKMILGQAAYQVAVALVLDFAGHSILGLNAPEGSFEAAREDIELSALIFNVFVWCQLFNQVNCRELGRRLNFFKGIHRNPWFGAIVLIEVGLQVLIIFVGGAAFSVTRLGGRDWAISIIAGAISWPLGVLIRLIPTDPIERLLIKWKIFPDPDALPTEAFDREGGVEKAKEYSEPALGEVAERLNFFAAIRGGRSRLANLSWKSRARRLREHDVHAQNLMAVVPGILGAGFVGAWKPKEDPAGPRS